MGLSMRHSIALVLLPLAIGCGGRDAGGEADASPGTTAGSGMVMPSMQTGGTMDQMQQHMQMMGTVSGDSMKALLPEHRQRVGDMLGQMNREMLDMNMTMDAAWTALADSLRGDLTGMGDLDAAGLPVFMLEHAQRVDRLMGMHRGMMGGMKM